MEDQLEKDKGYLRTEYFIFLMILILGLCIVLYMSTKQTRKALDLANKYSELVDRCDEVTDLQVADAMRLEAELLKARAISAADSVRLAHQEELIKVLKK